MLNYKGFIGSVEYDDSAETFYGTVVNANAVMSFRGRSVGELKTSFHDVVDTYLDDCAVRGVDPEKPYNGKITLRVPPELHRRLAARAASRRTSMNNYLESILERDVETADI
ncbi:MAG: type II toxin-antitoxin system HicB family antitoxin [Rectinema sp.]